MLRRANFFLELVLLFSAAELPVITSAVGLKKRTGPTDADLELYSTQLTEEDDEELIAVEPLAGRRRGETSPLNFESLAARAGAQGSSFCGSGSLTGNRKRQLFCASIVAAACLAVPTVLSRVHNPQPALSTSSLPPEKQHRPMFSTTTPPFFAYHAGVPTTSSVLPYDMTSTTWYPAFRDTETATSTPILNEMAAPSVWSPGVDPTTQEMIRESRVEGMNAGAAAAGTASAGMPLSDDELGDMVQRARMEGMESINNGEQSSGDGDEQMGRDPRRGDTGGVARRGPTSGGSESVSSQSATAAPETTPAGTAAGSTIPPPAVVVQQTASAGASGGPPPGTGHDGYGASSGERGGTTSRARSREGGVARTSGGARSSTESMPQTMQQYDGSADGSGAPENVSATTQEDSIPDPQQCFRLLYLPETAPKLWKALEQDFFDNYFSFFCSREEYKMHLGESWYDVRKQATSHSTTIAPRRRAAAPLGNLLENKPKSKASPSLGRSSFQSEITSAEEQGGIVPTYGRRLSHVFMGNPGSVDDRFTALMEEEIESTGEPSIEEHISGFCSRFGVGVNLKTAKLRELAFRAEAAMLTLRNLTTQYQRARKNRDAFVRAAGFARLTKETEEEKRPFTLRRSASPGTAIDTEPSSRDELYAHEWAAETRDALMEVRAAQVDLASVHQECLRSADTNLMQLFGGVVQQDMFHTGADLPLGNEVRMESGCPEVSWFSPQGHQWMRSSTETMLVSYLENAVMNSFLSQGTDTPSTYLGDMLPFSQVMQYHPVLPDGSYGNYVRPKCSSSGSSTSEQGKTHTQAGEKSVKKQSKNLSGSKICDESKTDVDLLSIIPMDWTVADPRREFAFEPDLSHVDSRRRLVKEGSTSAPQSLAFQPWSTGPAESVIGSALVRNPLREECADKWKVAKPDLVPHVGQPLQVDGFTVAGATNLLVKANRHQVMH
ncbi:unnamed protein product [Amoebophrya sp. A120]|nr:unnamed protein product [Amoebophrya sp. A120]|eukprot:GSA120T00018899001.1